jgi:hypothetical protein
VSPGKKITVELQFRHAQTIYSSEILHPVPLESPANTKRRGIRRRRLKARRATTRSFPCVLKDFKRMRNRWIVQKGLFRVLAMRETRNAFCPAFVTAAGLPPHCSRVPNSIPRLRNRWIIQNVLSKLSIEVAFFGWISPRCPVPIANNIGIGRKAKTYPTRSTAKQQRQFFLSTCKTCWTELGNPRHIPSFVAFGVPTTGGPRRQLK